MGEVNRASQVDPAPSAAGEVSADGGVDQRGRALARDVQATTPQVGPIAGERGVGEGQRPSLGHLDGAAGPTFVANRSFTVSLVIVDGGVSHHQCPTFIVYSTAAIGLVVPDHATRDRQRPPVLHRATGADVRPWVAVADGHLFDAHANSRGYKKDAVAGLSRSLVGLDCGLIGTSPAKRDVLVQHHPRFGVNGVGHVNHAARPRVGVVDCGLDGGEVTAIRAHGDRVRLSGNFLQRGSAGWRWGRAGDWRSRWFRRRSGGTGEMWRAGRH